MQEMLVMQDLEELREIQDEEGQKGMQVCVISFFHI